MSPVMARLGASLTKLPLAWLTGSSSNTPVSQVPATKKLEPYIPTQQHHLPTYVLTVPNVPPLHFGWVGKVGSVNKG